MYFIEIGLPVHKLPHFWMVCSENLELYYSFRLLPSKDIDAVNALFLWSEGEGSLLLHAQARGNRLVTKEDRVLDLAHGVIALVHDLHCHGLAGAGFQGTAISLIFRPSLGLPSFSLPTTGAEAP